MKAPEEIIKLIERFEDNIDAYKSAKYNETQVRQEFINPFFKALGWDVDNVQGWAEAYKDVIHEDAIKIGGTTKAPDYCFRIGGTRKFFLEAKKPSVNIKDDINPSYQLRRYAWSAKLPLSILTDFEEFAVYDCRFKPVKTDKASTARILYFNYKDYAAKWEEISSIFSRDAILKGSFDKYIESGKKKSGTAEVDSAFLKEIESWRENLAKNIAIRNPSLSQRAVNFSVQKIIDRIIFLRISEDRGLESAGALREIGDKNNVYEKLCELFLKADERYNSGIFHFKKEKDISTHPDELTLTIKLDDAPLKSILKNLYYPDSPYEFSVLPADILGHVYEQFLGKVIRLTDSHRAVIEEKPEVRKAGGVYYTPTYIVDYIVKNTVGKLLEDKTPAQASKLKILDPACGSGSFLIGAYQYLLNWHLQQYQDVLKKTKKIPHITVPPKGGAKSKKPHSAIYQGAGGDWRLTLYEKKRILLNNIYGVDIDDQAVEVTKLSLLLKVLEGESQMHLFHERILPDLGSNIKCGNSLIGPDFYENQQMDLLDEKERYRINVFDWKAEFPEILTGPNPGFDAVIGNPPYIRLQTMQVPELEYYRQKFISAGQGNYDIYIVFIEKGFMLLRKQGLYGMILPHKCFQADYGQKIRKFISDRKAIYEIVNFSTNQIFEKATTYTCLLFLENCPNNSFRNITYELGSNIKQRLFDRNKFLSVSSDALIPDVWNFYSPEVHSVLKRISKVPMKLKDITLKIFKGSSTGNDKIYLLKVTETGNVIKCFSQILGREITLELKAVKPFLFGSDIKRYDVLRSNWVLLLPYQLVDDKYQLIPPKQLQELYPLAYEYLLAVKDILIKRKIITSSSDFYKYSAARSLNEYSNPRILVPDILVKNRINIDLQGAFFHGPAIHSIIFNSKVREHNELYFLGVFNSKIFWFFITHTSTALQGNAFRLTPNYISKFPIRVIDFNNSLDVARHNKIVELVTHMLELHKQLAETKTSPDKTVIQRQIDATDHQIDQLVYDLYDLTPVEIKIIEEVNK
ncbi:MAG: N-6 DNA methylase [Candidatus Omnitrophica bacterium]|nr:N-6 DNA methylase [Candidatus Omnitrophota bacterium]